MNIIKAETGHEKTVAALACKLWPEYSLNELAETYRQLLAADNGAVFITYSGTRPVGFAHCQLRRDYVEGSSASPTGYLEGIFVEETFRKQGYAAKLLTACEDWCRTCGCTEFASDCEIENRASAAFHIKNGFAEANRIVCFIKKL